MTNSKTIAVLCLSMAAFAAMAIAAPSEPVRLASEEVGQPLTLTGARHIVADRLTAMGQRNLRPGRAEFGDDGNVVVEIVTFPAGLPVRKVIVDAKSGQVTDARTGTPIAMRV